uniref:acid phosphatase n=1 Tax=Macrostomum lignano TaxID=282301 RepID=A0A1I8HR95_9PLAT
MGVAVLLLRALLLLAAAVAASVPAEPNRLMQIVVLVRHGDRSAMRSLPIDPHSELLDQVGPAQLLEQGVRQLFRLGVWLRRRYDNQSLLPRRFNTSTMEVRSTDTDRTLMSAQALLAGLFPGQCAGDGTSMPVCYPVPVHSKPTQTDQLLKMSSPCAAYQHRWRQFRARPNGPFKSAVREFRWLAELARNRTGWPGPDDCPIKQLWRVEDSVSSWQRMGLAMPSWVNGTVREGLAELKRRKFLWKYEEPQLHSARMGLLVARLLGGMRLRLEGKTAKALQVYSAHDSTVAAFLHAFQVFNGLRPPMAACIIAELYASGEFRLVYKNSTEQPAVHQLSIPFCPPPCFLPQLESEMRRRGVWAETAQAMCGGGGDLAEDSQQDEPLGAVYNFILVIVLSVSWLPLLY